MASTSISAATSGTPTNNKKFTFSFWVKRHKLGSTQSIYIHERGSGYGHTHKVEFGFHSEDTFYFGTWDGSNEYYSRTKRKFRDTNAWMHIMVVVDSTQATNTNRLKWYFNGEQYSIDGAMFDAGPSYPAQNWVFNSNTWSHNIGRYVASSGASNYLDASLSDFCFVDGQALTPSSFGETDTDTGEWRIKDFTAGDITWGTNGYRILKDGNSINDVSSNSHNFTADTGTLTKTEDNPSNVFATMNFAGSDYGNYTLTKGNLVCYGGNNNDWKSAFISNIGATSGKYYWEIRLNTCTSYNITGVCRSDKTWTNSNVYSNGGFNGVQSSTSAGGLGIYSQTGASMGGALYIGGTSVSLTANDIIMYALDLDNKKMWIGKNGVWADDGNSGNTGNPSTGAYPLWGTGEFTTGSHYLPASIIYYTNAHVYNFGNGYFETTQVSAGTNASGNGIFEYDVPTGFTAWSTKGLNL
jgi:hypothetical protein